MQYDLSMPRYTIDFDKEFDKTLSDLVASTDATTKADVIRRAVASYSFLKNSRRKTRTPRLSSPTTINSGRKLYCPSECQTS